MKNDVVAIYLKFVVFHIAANSVRKILHIFDRIAQSMFMIFCSIPRETTFLSYYNQALTLSTTIRIYMNFYLKKMYAVLLQDFNYYLICDFCLIFVLLLFCQIILTTNVYKCAKILALIPHSFRDNNKIVLA